MYYIIALAFVIIVWVFVIIGVVNCQDLFVNFLKILSGFPGVITFAYNGPTRPIVIENGSYYVLSTLSLINESEPVAKVKKVKAGAKKEEEAEQEESEEENEDEVVEQYNAED